MVMQPHRTSLPIKPDGASASLSSTLKYDTKTLKDNHHADARPSLLTGSPTVDEDDEEISSFVREETEADPHIETNDLEKTVNFIENHSNEVYHVLETKEEKTPYSKR